MASMLEQMVIDRTIDHYRIVRRIGQGGMGTVYLATHEKTGRRAAIKFLHASAGPESWARFFNEARAAAYIAHPGVITIYHDGVLEPERLPYIIMEYLEGDSLAAHFAAAGRGYRPEWLRYVRQIASAMAAVHTQGIVHRDLKPENIMLIRDPEVPGGLRVKILDFGIAKLQSKHYLPANSPFGELAMADIETVLATAHGVAMGTPLYMSPQQFAGSQYIDGKADVYALGAICYWLLTGEPLFHETNFMALMHQHVHGAHIPLAERVPWLRDDVATLVESMLDKRPSLRPSMQDIADALESWDVSDPQNQPASDKPTLLLSDSGNHSIVKALRLSRKNAGIAVAVALAALLAVVAAQIL
jgi:serine/threonine-protein kinase